MLTKVMIDFRRIDRFKDEIDHEEYFLLPYIYLFADEVLEPVPWDGSPEIEVELPSYIKPVLIPSHAEPYVCDYAIATYRLGDPQYMGAYFSPVRSFKKRMVNSGDII